jgi:probable HAF family extracellular repeat protein
MKRMALGLAGAGTIGREANMRGTPLHLATVLLVASVACETKEAIVGPRSLELAAITVTDLGTLPGGFPTKAHGINGSGTVVGGSSVSGSGDTRAVRWTLGGQIPSIEDLTTVAAFPGGTTSSLAHDVNSSGLIVGTMEIGGSRHGFLLSGSSVTDVGALSGAIHTVARGLNAAGQVVGESGGRAFLWTAASGIQELPSLPGGGSPFGGLVSSAADINSTETVVGYSYDTAGVQHAVRWVAAGGSWTIQKLSNSDFAAGEDVNDGGDIVGSRRTASGRAHAYLWPAGGGSTDLGTLGGGVSVAYGINSQQHVVGWSYTRTGVQRAFRWTPAGGMQNLGTLAGTKNTVGAAWAISDNRIVGESDFTRNVSPDMHATLWTVN